MCLLFSRCSTLFRSIIHGTLRERILEILETKHVVSADNAVMRKAGKLSGELIDGGERIEREDCIIAATALLNDEPVITRNTEHFGPIDGLEVRPY